MSQLSELTDLTRQLAVLVRENREEISALRARVKALERKQSSWADDLIMEKLNANEPVIIDLSGIDLK